MKRVTKGEKSESKRKTARKERIPKKKVVEEVMKAPSTSKKIRYN